MENMGSFAGTSLIMNQGSLIHSQGEGNNLYNQLWFACAGPMVYLPCIGDKVYYFPQGHIEQVEAYMKNDDGPVEMPKYNLPSKILCKVVTIHLQAETITDEVFAQITLVPVRENELLTSHKEPDSSTKPKKSKARSYTKKLTPSDTDMHSGFSIPKQCAVDIFPNLDMFQEVPSGELVAKDLHGCTWKFCHIYRGQPKRHLLTSGWRLFVFVKKLVAGDTVIFIRGENGELYIGIHRARKPKNMTSLLSCISMQHGILANAVQVMSTNSMFNVYYRPWTDPAQYIVPYDQYMKFAEIDYSVGTRFKMPLETVESTEYMKFSGTIIGSEDLDSIRWPNSEWRQLKVEWDDTSEMLICPVRVSPWSIEPIGVIRKKSVPDISNQKIPRPRDPSALDLPFVLNNEDLLKSQKERQIGVLQGQEDKAIDRQELIGAATESNGCKFRLFGVNLWDNSQGSISPKVVLSNPSTLSSTSPSLSLPTISKVQITRRSGTNVFMDENVLGCLIDLTLCKDYIDLIKDLDRFLELNGKLVNETYLWHVTYTNINGDEFRLGDCHWREFVTVVQKMLICPKKDGYIYKEEPFCLVELTFKH